MKCSLLLLLIPCLSMAVAEKSEVEKRINKEFNVQPESSLAIDNKYGRIDVAIGATNRIKIEVVMKVKAGSEKKAQETLDRISVDISQSGSRVSASTVFPPHQDGCPGLIPAMSKWRSITMSSCQPISMSISGKNTVVCLWKPPIGTSGLT